MYEVGQNDFCAIAAQYAADVVAGKIPACRIVQQACQRQIDDLSREPSNEWPWIWDPGRGNVVCDFIESLPHIEGRWKSTNIELEPWQCFFLTTIFGWVDHDGNRRFRRAYIEVPRKNGKSILCSAVALYLLCADDEMGPQVYSAAVDREQAKVVWKVAREMVLRSPEMQEFYKIFATAHSLIVPENAGIFVPLSRDTKKLEGLNPHGAIIDELHAHKTPEIFDVINQATGARRQPLILIITTAGDNKAGVCYSQHDYVEQILSGRHEDDRYFGIIYSLDVEDSWDSEQAARKANPNYGVSALPEDLHSALLQAKRRADQQNTYKTVRLNLWVSVGTAYFNMLAWSNRCKVPGLKLEDFYETDEQPLQSCFIGLDLASRGDLASKVILFSRDIEKPGRGMVKEYYVFGKHYLPEDVALNPDNPRAAIYRKWADDGWLTLTPGNYIDFEFIEQDLVFDRDNFRVREIGFDPDKATELNTRMRKEGLKMAEVRMSVHHMSEPMKLLAELIVAGDIKHNGDPVLEWAMGNVYGQPDAKDGVFPKKVNARYENKIDPAVATIMALSRDIAHGVKASVYDTREPRFL